MERAARSSSSFFFFCVRRHRNRERTYIFAFVYALMYIDTRKKTKIAQKWQRQINNLLFSSSFCSLSLSLPSTPFRSLHRAGGCVIGDRRYRYTHSQKYTHTHKMSPHIFLDKNYTIYHHRIVQIVLSARAFARARAHWRRQPANSFIIYFYLC